MAIPDAIKLRPAFQLIKEGKPGERILNLANLLPPLPGADKPFGDQPDHALCKLMRAFYEYGRGNSGIGHASFTWAPDADQNAKPPGLLTGAASSANCIAFSKNLWWLAREVCGIDGIETESYNGHFLTEPNWVECIDAGWRGNVRGKRVVGGPCICFKFSAHHWLRLGAKRYDVCFNIGFHALHPVVFAALEKVHCVGDEGYMLMKTTHPIPDIPAYIIKLRDEHGWPLWQLVDQLP